LTQSSRASNTRSFMCGALSKKGDAADELAFATELINRVTAGLPSERLALHVCRGNWTRDESAALSGDYGPLIPLLQRVSVGTLLLELSTPRAGDIGVLKDLPPTVRLGVGVVNQKQDRIESIDEIVACGRRAIGLLGAERVVLTPDCGFATFADNPVASARVAEASSARSSKPLPNCEGASPFFVDKATRIAARQVGLLSAQAPIIDPPRARALSSADRCRALQLRRPRRFAREVLDALHAHPTQGPGLRKMEVSLRCPWSDAEDEWIQRWPAVAECGGPE
jgi:hypothetical protein